MDERMIQEMVLRIVAVADPEKVVIFGSRARGDDDPESDVDLLVIQETDLPRPKRSVPLYAALRDYPFPIDVVVYSPEEVEEFKNLPLSFIQTALREGRVLYEK